MRRLELRDFVVGPGVKSVAAEFVWLDAGRRVAGDHIETDGVVQKHADYLGQIVRSRRRLLRLVGDDLPNMFAPQPLEREVTVFSAKTVEDSATMAPAALLEA